MASGTAKLGMAVAEMLRKNRKMTSTTRQMVSKSVNLTSAMDSRIDSERSWRMLIFTEGGICERNCGSSLRMPSTTSMVLVPGWRWMPSTIDCVSMNQLMLLSFSTLSMTLASSARRTGLPLRYATISGLNAAALKSCPFDCTVNACLAP